MAVSVGRAETPLAQQYLTQLCKHFGHKLPAEYGEGRGSITFPIGICGLRVEGNSLVVELQSESAEKLPDFQNVIARHLDRFTFREPVAIVWSE